MEWLLALGAAFHPRAILYLSGLVWIVIAYAGALYCAVRVFDRLKSPAPPRPFCTVAAATRWMLHRRPRGASITPIDKMRMASLLILAATGIFIAWVMVDLFTVLSNWPPLKPPGDLLRLLGHGVMGSGLIIILSGTGALIDEMRGNECT